MKTAISVEDSLMEEADQAARSLGMSRSGFISEALKGHLKDLRQKRITEQLNRAYAEMPTQEERRLVRRFKTKLPIQDRW